MFIREILFLLFLFTSVRSCEDKLKSMSVLDILKSKYSKYKIGDKFDLRTKSSVSTLTVHSIEGNDDCIGLTIQEKQIIVLRCSGKQQEEPGCFDVIPVKSTSQNITQITYNKINKTCGGVFKLQYEGTIECVVGLRINDNSTIVLAGIWGIKGLASSLPDNRPPERMK